MFSPVCPSPTFLAEALAQGKLPKVTELRFFEDIWCLKNEEISAQLASAISAGHFERLQDLFVEGGVHVALFLHAFRARLEPASHHGNVICGTRPAS